MELDSPANGFGELNDLLKEDEPSLTDELHPSYAVNKEENTAEYDFDNLASSNNILVDLAQHEQENPLTMHNEFPYYEFSESPKKFLSPSQTGVDGSVLDETKFVSDEDRLLSSPLKYYHQEETEDLSSSYPSRSSFEHEQVPMHDDIEAEVSGHLLESFTRKGPIEEQEMKDKPASSSHEGMVGETTFDMMKYDLMISEIAGKELEEEPIDLQTETEDRPASSSQEGMVEETSFTKMKYDLDTSQIADKELGEEVTDPPCEKSHTSPISSVENVEIKIEKACYAKDSSVEEVTDPAGILHTYPKSPVDNVETEGGQGFHSEDHPPAHVRELEMPHFDQLTPDRGILPSKSPDRGSQMSPHAYLSHDSPKATSSQQDLQDLLYSSRSHRQKHGSLAENPEDLLLSDEQIPVSPGASQRGRRHVDDSYVKHIPASRGNHNSRPKHQRQDRSVSKSPVRLKESSSRHNREHRERSRSRPPDESFRHRRSPRRRYSPRRRSPRSDYHSHRRSPRRRQWSPPHNRSTGLGKPGRNLFVAGFSFLTTERDLERKFSRFGRVRDVRIVRDKRSGDSRGFGFLTLERDEEADAAIRALDKTEWNGRVVLVEKSKPH